MRSGTHRETEARGPLEPSPRRPDSGRRAVALGAGIVVALTAVFALTVVGAIRGVRDDLQRGRSAMDQGRVELREGNAAAASGSFREGRLSFTQAERRSDGLALEAVGWLPILGRSSDAIGAIAEAAVTTADAAIVLSDAAADVPGGLSGLGPTAGRIDPERFSPLARAAEKADRLMSQAVARLDRAPTSLLLVPIGSARDDADTELADLSESIHTSSLLLHGLPTFLGADEPQRYFFGAQNPAELRGTGGLIGAYSILEIDDGRFSFSPFVPIHDLPKLPLNSLPAPNDDYAENYDQFRRGGRFWTSINVMPDFPSVATAILTSYEAATGRKLDGVLLADPFAEKALLTTSGPVDIPDYDVQINARNVVPFTTNQAYSLFTDSPRRKRVLGDVATAAFTRFLSQPSTDVVDLRELFKAAASRHIQVFSTDPVMQEGLRRTPVGAALRLEGGTKNFMSVVVNSGAGSKVDFYQERTVDYTVDLRDDGSANGELVLTLDNRAPTSGQPPYVIGPFGRGGDNAGAILQNLEAGESVALVNVYCGTECEPRDALMNGSPTTVTTEVDLGMRFIRDYYAVKSGDHKALRLRWRNPSAWDGNGSGGAYRMTFANQVTIRPAMLRLRIEPPEGMHVISASAPLRIVDGVAVYEGTPGAHLDVSIEFGPSLPVRWWRNVERFLSTPVFEL
jgi:Protein of unknown function (DUF4012)